MSDLHVDHSPDEAPGLPAGSSFEVPSYDTAPEDQPYVERVLAMDPVADVPGPVELKGRITVPARPTLKSLPLHLREDVERKLASVPPSKYDEAQREFVLEALRANSLEARTVTGLGPDALPFHREQVAIAAQGRQLVQEFGRNAEALDEVSHHETRFDEATGKQEPFPVLRLQGEQREATFRRQEQISYHLNLLQGIEGKRRLDKAMAETVALLKAREAQAADEAEVARRVEDQEREARINARVQTKLRMRGVEVKG